MSPASFPPDAPASLGPTGARQRPPRDHRRAQHVGTTPGALEASDAKLTQALADVATIAVLQSRATAEADELNTHLQRALDHRVVIEQPKGVIAEQAGIDTRPSPASIALAFDSEGPWTVSRPMMLERSAVTDSPAVESSCSGDAVVDVAVRVRGPWAIVMVGGDLDLLTAPDLLVLLRGVIGRGHRNVVLDLEHVSLLGAAGVGVIASAANMAHREGGGFTVCSPSPLSRRVLQACSFGDLIGSKPASAPAARTSRQALVAWPRVEGATVHR